MLFIISTVSGYLILKAFLFTFYLESWFRTFFDLLTPFGRRLWPEVGFSNSKNICCGVTFGTCRKLTVYCMNLFWCDPKTDPTSGHNFRPNGANRPQNVKKTAPKVKRKTKGRVYRQVYSICDTLVPDERNFGLFSNRK